MIGSELNLVIQTDLLITNSFHQIPLARSEGNLLELMEEVCERMEDYGEKTDPSTNRKSYIRIKSRNGEAMDLSEAALDSRVTASLKFAVSTFYYASCTDMRGKKTSFCFAFVSKLFIFNLHFCESWRLSTFLCTFRPQCETIVEHHEDEIIEFFAHKTENVKDKLCSKRTGRFSARRSLQFSLILCLPASYKQSIEVLIISLTVCFLSFALQTSVTTL